MTVIAFEILLIFTLILANGVFSLSEIAVLSARKARLQRLADAGNSGARVALTTAEEPATFLATVQVGITLIGVFAGALGGATLATEVATALAKMPYIGQYSEAIGLGIVVLCITYFSLVIGELIPKRLALLHAESMAALLAPPMRVLAVGVAPIVRILTASTDLLLRLFGVNLDAETTVTDEDVKFLIQQSAQVGIIAPIEEEMMQNVFLVGDQTIKALMTPRQEIDWLDLSASSEDILKRIMASEHTRFPVGQGSVDHIVGIVLAKEVLAQSLSGQPITLATVSHPALFIPESLPALQVLIRFQESHSQIALVVGEHGEIQGLVTVADLLEAIVGDLPEFPSNLDIEVVERADGSWLVDGMLPLYEFAQRFLREALPDEITRFCHTLGGFVMAQLGRVPIAGDYFEWEELRFEVVDMDGNRVDKVLISKGQSPNVYDHVRAGQSQSTR